MPVQVRIPELLRDAASGQVDVEADATTVRELIGTLDERYPGFRARLIDDSGLRRYWCVYVNGRDTRLGASLDTALTSDDVVWILPATSGGMFLP
jgi:MoaD family protein